MKQIKKILTLIVAAYYFAGCTPYNPDNYLKSQEEKDSLVISFLPYVLPRPDNISLAQRFSDSMSVFFKNRMKSNELALNSYYINSDSLHYCMFVRRDLKSLYIDYRAVAASFKRNKDSIYDVELKFLTPMFRRDTIYRKADELFKVLVETGNVNSYIGNRDFIDWPSQDVYYDKVEKKWAFREASEWYKLKEEIRKEQ